MRDTRPLSFVARDGQASESGDHSDNLTDWWSGAHATRAFVAQWTWRRTAANKGISTTDGALRTCCNTTASLIVSRHGYLLDISRFSRVNLNESMAVHVEFCNRRSRADNACHRPRHSKGTELVLVGANTKHIGANMITWHRRGLNKLRLHLGKIKEKLEFVFISFILSSPTWQAAHYYYYFRILHYG